MQIVMSTYALNFAGTESYFLTVAEQLQRLGHDVTLLSVELGPNAAVVRDRGLELRERVDELPPACDVVYAQDSVTAYELAERYPETPQVYAAHADEYDLQTPPQIPGVVQAVVVLHDRLERQVRALAVAPEIVRLRQPVDVKRFYPRTALHDPPLRALILSNYVNHDRLELVRHACADAGIECAQLGAPSGVWTDQAEVEICRADIVFGKARVIVEAMASGRAAYVYDLNGGDGWMTPERYDLLEADNFGGQAESTATDRKRLRRDLIAYSPEMGPANRDLAVANHSARRHAQELVALFERLAGRRERIDAPLAELSRLIRLQWVTEMRAAHLAAENQRLRDQLDLARVQSKRVSPPSLRVPHLLRAVARRAGGRRAWRIVRRLSGSKRREERRAHYV
jgi:hypothetical protein